MAQSCTPNGGLGSPVSTSHPYAVELDAVMQSVFGTLRSLVNPGVDRNGALATFRVAVATLSDFQDRYRSNWSEQQANNIQSIIDQINTMHDGLAASPVYSGASPGMMENAYRRMNAWRQEGDPMKTTSLAEYIDRQVERPEVDAPPRPTAPSPGAETPSLRTRLPPLTLSPSF